MQNSLIVIGVFTAASAITGMADAAVVEPNLPGTTQYDGWDTLTVNRLPGYGSYPGDAAWPGTVGSNSTGSLDAVFGKASGNGFFASQSMYVGAGARGNFFVKDTTPHAVTKTVVFQIDIGSGGVDGQDVVGGTGTLDMSLEPTLVVNNVSASPLVHRKRVIISSSTGVNSGGNAPAGDGEATLVTWQYWWDLSTFAGTVNDLQVNWQQFEHSQTYGLRLDSSNVSVAAVPEPATFALVVLGVAPLLVRRRAECAA